MGVEYSGATHLGGHHETLPPPSHPASLHPTPFLLQAGQAPLGWKGHSVSPEDRTGHLPVNKATKVKELMVKLQKIHRHFPRAVSDNSENYGRFEGATRLTAAFTLLLSHWGPGPRAPCFSPNTTPTFHGRGLLSRGLTSSGPQRCKARSGLLSPLGQTRQQPPAPVTQPRSQSPL